MIENILYGDRPAFAAETVPGSFDDVKLCGRICALGALRGGQRNDPVAVSVQEQYVFRIARRSVIPYVNTAMHTVPAVKSAKPSHAFADSFSLKTMSENNTVIKMLKRSMGTTTLTCPCWMA